MQRLLTLITLALVVTGVNAQPAWVERLPAEQLNVLPPSARVSGEPGRLTVQSRPCARNDGEQLRRRIVDIAVQEWAYFGFSVQDETDPENWARNRRPRSALSEAELAAMRAATEARIIEAQRVVDSIAGYWAATPDGSWIINRQNDAWVRSNGQQARWVQPWSAAFISWVMCEAGLGESSAFRRAIAHHAYIDQAIRARDNGDRSAAYVAYDVGEVPVAPGDLLCTARRPAYSSLADRRRQLGDGASTHCDVVVQIDEDSDRFLAIGGNVRGTVGLKLLPATRNAAGALEPAPAARTVFAHLQLQADVDQQVTLHGSPTMATLRCNGAAASLAQEPLAQLLASPEALAPMACQQPGAPAGRHAGTNAN
jgi:hypothetical protein